VYECRDKQNLQGFKYKCEPPRGICDQTIETSVLLTKVEELFEDHVQPQSVSLENGGAMHHLHSNTGMFLVAVQIMLSNVRAEREGDWLAHLMSSLKMLPYFVITNRTSYSIFYDGFFSAYIAPNTIETAGYLSNGKLVFFKS
jgi:hypothetical protein